MYHKLLCAQQFAGAIDQKALPPIDSEVLLCTLAVEILFMNLSSAPVALIFPPDGTILAIYACPSSGEAYRDRRLTTNFELWVEIFCVPTCFHVRILKPCLSVCLSICLSVPEKRSHHSFVNISPTLIANWYTSTSALKPKKLNFS